MHFIFKKLKTKIRAKLPHSALYELRSFFIRSSQGSLGPFEGSLSILSVLDSSNSLILTHLDRSTVPELPSVVPVTPALSNFPCCASHFVLLHRCYNQIPIPKHFLQKLLIHTVNRSSSMACVSMACVSMVAAGTWHTPQF